MGKRRGSGEGTIFQRADGRWCGQLDVGTAPDGKRRRLTVYGAKRSEIVEKLRDLQRSEASRNALQASGRQTVETYAKEWLERRRLSVAPSTWSRDESLLSIHALPHIGSARLRSLTPQHIDYMLAAERSKMSPRSLRHLHGTVSKMLATALEMNLIEYNPARRVPKPRVPHTTRRIFTVEEAKRYAEAIEGHPFQAAMLLALIHGMRLGEILALQWADIDFERQTLTVQRSLTQGSDGRFYPGPTKTHRSSRPVQLADSVTAVLRQRKVIQNQERLKFGPGWEDNGGVFTRPDGRLLSKTNFGRAYHYRVIEENDLPRITFHDLRHCAASLGLMASINPKTIQEMLGHSSIAITLDVYSHVMPSTHREAGNAIAASVGL